jgi:rRNA-processing protein FCF1
MIAPQSLHLLSFNLQPPVFAIIHSNYIDLTYKKVKLSCTDEQEVFLNDKSVIFVMCFDYELTELERNLMKPIKQKKNIETEKLEERPLTVTA